MPIGRDFFATFRFIQGKSYRMKQLMGANNVDRKERSQ